MLGTACLWASPIATQDVRVNPGSLVPTYTPGFPGTSFQITTLTSAATTATATTATAHGLATGDWVSVIGASESKYNLVQQVTVTGANTFTYTINAGATTPEPNTAFTPNPVYCHTRMEKDGYMVTQTNRAKISALSQAAGTATATTSGAHGFVTGDTVMIMGAGDYRYNLKTSVTVTGSTTFTYAVNVATASPDANQNVSTYCYKVN
jgi:NADPH:quinone reductase-like Zn-dependent oxidoreductase